MHDFYQGLQHGGTNAGICWGLGSTVEQVVLKKWVLDDLDMRATGLSTSTRRNLLLHDFSLHAEAEANVFLLTLLASD